MLMLRTPAAANSAAAPKSFNFAQLLQHLKRTGFFKKRNAPGRCSVVVLESLSQVCQVSTDDLTEIFGFLIDSESDPRSMTLSGFLVEVKDYLQHSLNASAEQLRFLNSAHFVHAKKRVKLLPYLNVLCEAHDKRHPIIARSSIKSKFVAKSAMKRPKTPRRRRRASEMVTSISSKSAVRVSDAHSRLESKVTVTKTPRRRSLLPKTPSSTPRIWNGPEDDFKEQSKSPISSIIDSIKKDDSKLSKADLSAANGVDDTIVAGDKYGTHQTAAGFHSMDVDLESIDTASAKRDRSSGLLRLDSSQSTASKSSDATNDAKINDALMADASSLVETSEVGCECDTRYKPRLDIERMEWKASVASASLERLEIVDKLKREKQRVQESYDALHHEMFEVKQQLKLAVAGMHGAKSRTTVRKRKRSRAEIRDAGYVSPDETDVDSSMLGTANATAEASFSAEIFKEEPKQKQSKKKTPTRRRSLSRARVRRRSRVQNNNDTYADATDAKNGGEAADITMTSETLDIGALVEERIGDLSQLKVKQLQVYLRSNGLQAYGLKSDLMQRVADHFYEENPHLKQ